MLLELIKCEILIEGRPGLLNHLSLVEDGLINADNGGSGGNRMLHLLLYLLEHLVILHLEAHLVRAPPTPSDLDLLPADLELLVEGSQKTHSNRFTDHLAPLTVQE